MDNDLVTNFLNKPILNERFDKTVHFGKVHDSGLGDRLIYIYLISIVAYIRRTNCVIEWKNHPHPKRDAQLGQPLWGSFDLNIVKKYISFPKWVEIYPLGEAPKCNNMNQEWVVTGMEKIKLSREDYMGAPPHPIYDHEKKDNHAHNFCVHKSLRLWIQRITSKMDISEQELDDLCKKSQEIGPLIYINMSVDIPSQYLCFHFRGGDKRHLGSFVWNCRYETGNILKEIKKYRSEKILLVTDDDISFIQSQNINISHLNVIPSVVTDHTTACIRDLYILQCSKGIIQHAPHGWSSFSNFYNMASGKPLLSTCRNDYNLFMPDIYARQSGKKWTNFFNFYKVPDFLHLSTGHKV